MSIDAMVGVAGRLGRTVVADPLDRRVDPLDPVAVVRDATRAQSLADAGVRGRAADDDESVPLRTAPSGVGRSVLTNSPGVGQRAAQRGDVVAAVPVR